MTGRSPVLRIRPALPDDLAVGFTPMGVRRGVERKFGRYWDVARYEKRLAPLLRG